MGFQPLQAAKLSCGLDALGDQNGTDPFGERDHRLDEGHLGVVRVTPLMSAMSQFDQSGRSRSTCCKAA